MVKIGVIDTWFLKLRAMRTFMCVHANVHVDQLERSRELIRAFVQLNANARISMRIFITLWVHTWSSTKRDRLATI